MKKKLCLFLTAVLLLTTCTALCPVAAQQGMYGDSNNDGAVNANDALFVLKVSVGKAAADAQQHTLLDVDENALLNANDALLILKLSVGKLARFPADHGTVLVEEDSQWLTMSMEEIIDALDEPTPATPISDDYQVHADGGMIYNPLSREMDQADRTKYNLQPKTTGTLKLDDGSVLTYSLPTDVTAYDMIPIDYTLKNGSGSGPLYVEATTFEDQDGSYYDLCLPNKVEVKMEYEGYVAATQNGSNRPYLSRYGDNDVKGLQYPQYNATELIRSDTVEKSDYLWFRFKVTNTGNTILDGDGNGTFCFDPYLETADGTIINHSNLYLRLTEDLYPGESTLLYAYFNYPSGPNYLAEGDYTLHMNTIVRNEEANADWSTKIWGGYTYGTSSHDITIGATGGSSIKNQTVNKTFRTGTRNTWLHTYEEFTTSFDSWLKPQTIDPAQTNTLYVQPAAWSDRVVLKLMRGDGDTMKSVTIPLDVETDSITIRLNETADNYIVTDEGTKYPAMASQSMCDMRVNISQSPYAAEKQMDELLDMKECGVNLVTTTEAFNIATGSHQSTVPSDMQDSNWFMCDMVRKLGMRLEGFTSYLYGSAFGAAYWFTRDAKFRNNTSTGYGDSVVAEAEAMRGLYQFLRWGKNFYVNSDQKVVFNVEDTRGWMRIDFTARHPMGETSLKNFRAWCQKKYGTIEALNRAWTNEYVDFNYTSFDDIDPEANAGDDHGWFSFVFGSSDFIEWSQSTNDLDIFRTLERTQNYQTIIDSMKTYGPEHPDTGVPGINASMGIRTEGGNVTGVVPYDTDNSHFRHTYYSQRRCAIIPQILAKSGTVSMHSDYVTLPYSVREWETLIASSTALGITSMPLLQANRMRDIAINSTFFSGGYATEYNLTGSATRGVYINTQVSVFEAFKAIYENGGIPGVLWEDYLCDGYVTETQQKEMQFYSSKIAQMMESDAAKAWAVTDVPNVQAIYDLAVAEYSYSEDFLNATLETALAAR